MKIVVAVVLLALASAFLLVGISYILFPGQTPQPNTSKSIPIIEPLSDQILWTIQWLGVAALIAIFAVGALLLISRIKNR